MRFVEAIMTVDLRHNVVAGFERGFPDLSARPDLCTLVRLPWQPDVAACIADLRRPGGARAAPDGLARGAASAVLAEYAELGPSPVLGPSWSSTSASPTPAAHRLPALRRQDSPVYTVGHVADPRGVLSRMLQATVDLGLGAVAAAHEYGRAQYEINLRHGPALDSADRAFRFKSLVKELAARDGLLATFMGKPFNDDEGSGFHLHISLCDADGRQRCAAIRRADDGLAAVTPPLHRRPDRARARR